MVKPKGLHELKVCVITGPLQSHSGSYYTTMNNFLKILSPLVNEIFLVTSNFSDNLGPDSKVKILDINMSPQWRSGILFKTIYLIVAEVKVCCCLLRIHKQFDGPIFLLSGTSLIPTIMAKILKKTSVLTAVASNSTIVQMTHNSALFYRRLYYYYSYKILELLAFNATKYISVESPHVAVVMGLPLKKVIGNGHLYYIGDSHGPAQALSKRPFYIGYVGRLSQEKGVLNFVTALPQIALRRPNIRVIIIGSGALSDRIKVFLDQNALDRRVELLGWISHDKLPEYLNQLRLLALPSYTEGLPNIMLEAMACGTPVLATPVGGVPDVIVDGRTGFIMENNSPECIAKNVIRALSSPDLEQIAENGRQFVEENFTFEKTVENWKGILQQTIE